VIASPSTWYAHGHVSRKLRMAHFLARKI
jgi:hypothetical protein